MAFYCGRLDYKIKVNSNYSLATIPLRSNIYRYVFVSPTIIIIYMKRFVIHVMVVWEFESIRLVEENL